MKRVYNFNAGPSAMPLEVLEEVQQEFLDFKGTGMSVVEISHRSKAYQEMQDETIALMKKLLNIPEGYKIVFLQGGGSHQFLMVAMNFLKGKAGYINTGVWSKKAKEAAAFYGDVYDVATSAGDNFSFIPDMNEAGTFDIEPDTDYVYLTSNNTIHGTEWQTFPHFDVPLIADMSSDFLARPVDVAKFDLIYAGIQKNVGPAGAVVVIIKEELLEIAYHIAVSRIENALYQPKKIDRQKAVKALHKEVEEAILQKFPEANMRQCMARLQEIRYVWQIQAL